MNEENTSLQAMVPVLINEARRHRVVLATIFAVIALAAMAVGLLWPKQYQASTTILAQESSIITPLMEGAATPTGTSSRAGIARAVIFSRKVMDQILVTGGWMEKHPNAVEQDRIIDGIKSRTQVKFSRDNLITINYRDTDPERTYDVTRAFAKLFISESLASKRDESRDAFNFINSQVEAYRKKLTDAEQKLKAYREANVDARPGSGSDTDTRISQLRTQIENARLELTEKRSQEASLVAQLQGESEVNTVQTTAGVYRAQLAQLQTELDKLLLTYTDEYPDVVRTRHQIQDLRKQLAQAEEAGKKARESGTPTTLGSNVRFNPLYQQMKSQLSSLRSDIAATTARMGASKTLLQAELERSARIANSENVTAELTRDYNVNRDVYQDLLKRRENARVSMNLDAKHQGLTFLIQNPAVMPLVPSGLRFMHFALAGGLLSLAVPFGLLFGVARFDPRIRSVKQLESLAGVTVLATVPVYATPGDRRRDYLRNAALAVIIAGVAVAYLVVLWLKLRAAA